MNKGKLNAMIQKVSQNTGIVYNSVLATALATIAVANKIATSKTVTGG